MAEFEKGGIVEQMLKREREKTARAKATAEREAKLKAAIEAENAKQKPKSLLEKLRDRKKELDSY